MSEGPELTPTEELIVEVLIARHRLGHIVWTFGRNAAVTKALDSLANKGLVWHKHGVVENTYLARLTQKATDLYMTSDYLAPIQGGEA